MPQPRASVAAPIVVTVFSHVLVSQALSLMLPAAGMSVRAALSDAHGLNAVWRHERPDVVVCDSVLQRGLDGIAAAAHLRRGEPASRVLVLSARHDHGAILAALDARVQGFVRSTAPESVLLGAIHDVAAGGEAYDPQTANDIVRAVRQARDAEWIFTPRERDVLRAICDGTTSTDDLARLLHMGQATVKSHVSSLEAKLKVHDRAGLVSAAYRAGLVPDRRLT